MDLGPPKFFWDTLDIFGSHWNDLQAGTLEHPGWPIDTSSPLSTIWYLHRVPNWVHKSCSKLGFVCGMDGSWVNENLVPNWVQYLSSKFGEQLLYLIGCTICVPSWVLNLCAKLGTQLMCPIWFYMFNDF